MNRLPADKIKVVGDCHIWQGPAHYHGYARIDRGGKRLYVHRVAYEDAHGPIPPRLVVRHACGNRLCVKPAHLILGTQAENVQDTVRMGRTTRGVKNPQAKITEAIAKEIKRLVEEEGYLHKEVASMFAVSKSLVGLIVNNKRWSYNDRYRSE